MAPSMLSRRTRALSVLSAGITFSLLALVVAAPPASADWAGPYKPGTTITETGKGRTVEWRIDQENACDGFMLTWEITWFGGSGIDQPGAVISDESGEDDMEGVTITTTITGDIGSTATPGVSINFEGESFDPEGDPCFETVSLDDSFVVTAPVVKTTVSLKHKPALPGFTGAVTAAEGCDAGRKVHLYKVDAGPDTHLDTKTSASDGTFKFQRRTPRRTYYVRVPKDDRTSLVCAAAKSSNVKVD